MSDQKQNGDQHQQLQVPEGDKFLFVRIGKDNSLQVLFSDHLDAISLVKVASAWLDENIIIPSVRPQQAHVSIPGVNPDLLNLLRKRGVKAS